MPASAERGMSAPPEVVFNTATDPDRFAAWLPPPLHRDGTRLTATTGDLQARWSPDPQGWAAELAVRQGAAGGAVVRLELAAAELSEEQLAELVDDSLTKLARHVADNLTAG